MNKLIICLLVGLMMFTLVPGLTSASDDDYMGTMCEQVPIIETCGDLGAPCDSSYSCNLTVTSPSQKVIILNLPMTRNDTIYNFTLVDTCELGVYKIKSFCGNGTFSGESIDGELRITTTGDTNNTLKLIIVLLVGALVLLFIGIYVHNYPIGFLSGITFMVAGTYIMIYGLWNMSDLYTRAIAGIVIAVGAILSMAAGYEQLKE